MKLRALLVLSCFAALPLGSQSAGVTAFVNARVVDGSGAPARTATVVVRGDRIEAVGENLPVPAGAVIVDTRGHTLLPGLFDVHTHLPYSAVAGLSADWGKVLKAYLVCGVTSVVDFGANPEMIAPMRELLASGVVPGPRISFAARFSTPGGHGTEAGWGSFFTQEVSTAAEARAAIRRILPYKPDVLKIFTDGWRYNAAPDLSSMNLETLTAIVDEAHRNGMKVLTHTVTVARAKIAARAGVDVIAHGMGDEAVDPELLRLMKERGVTYAPTLAVYEPEKRSGGLPHLLARTLEPEALKRVRALRPQPPARSRMERWKFLMANNTALHDAGARFAAGTDAGVTGTYHGWSTLREIELLVEGGLAPLEAIHAATGAAAAALGLDRDRGTIAAGKLADLVLIEGDPHERIAGIRAVRRVWLGGREVPRERLLRDIESPAMTPIPARKATAMIDDFERPDGRTLLNTLPVDSTDSGADHSRLLLTRILRSQGNRALAITARMAARRSPYVSVSFPLTRGPVEPADASDFSGIEFDARGEGDFGVQLHARSIRDGEAHEARFAAWAEWRAVRLPFAAFERPHGFSRSPLPSRDLLKVQFQIDRPPEAEAWLEIDNLRFVR